MDKPYRKKLIEVALPLDAINAASAREKSIRHGHPSTLHLWWARRPLAACRAVLFSQLVDDPSEYMPDEESANEERERLFRLIEDFVKWENINNEELLDKARLVIARSVARDLGEPVPIGKAAVREFLATKAPPVLDPFAGGGSIPLEAQRLGLRAYASDLNPVAVLINKAMIEMPPKFANMPPVHPSEDEKGQKTFLRKSWKGAEGLAEDVRFYGHWMKEEAKKRIGHLYPNVVISEEILDDRDDLIRDGYQSGDELTVIAWLWARTIKCPNPACGAQMPFLSSLNLSTKKNNKAWLVPIVDKKKLPPRINFKVLTGAGTPPPSPKIGRGARFRCIACEQIAPEKDIRKSFQEKKANMQMVAIVAEGKRSGKVYLPPDKEHVNIAKSETPSWMPETEMNVNTPNLVSGRGYGFTHWNELFSPRQLVEITTFVDMLRDVWSKVDQDVCNSNISQKSSKGDISNTYADAITTYLAFVTDRVIDKSSTLAWWMTGAEKMAPTLSRQAIAMVWDFAEMNPFCNVTSNFGASVEWVAKVLEFLPINIVRGSVRLDDATNSVKSFGSSMISTDPPYYDNIAYADLSDFFYIWLRIGLGSIHNNLFTTVLVPKRGELVAASERFEGDRSRAKDFFENGLRNVFSEINSTALNNFPVSIFYAFRQTEELSQGRSSTGWETMLDALLNSGFQITGTWPIRTERGGGLRNLNQNALASSIVLVCRPRIENAPVATRRDFISSLKRELPGALTQLKQGSIAPVDLAQASIGPGMAVYSRFSKVLEADGSSMLIRSALSLINQALDEFLAEQEGEFDPDTRWALAWYEQYGHSEGPFGVAETLSKAKNTSVDGLEQAGILEARAGKVKLLHRSQLVDDWDPVQDKRLTVWEVTHYLIRALDHGGESEAAFLLSHIGSLGEASRDLAYRLYTICERKGWAQDALGYNMLVVAWPRLKEMARSNHQPEQGKLL